MKKAFPYILFFIFGINLFTANAQTFQKDYKSILHNLIGENLEHDSQADDKEAVFKGESSELKLFFLGSLKLYQTLISSQDMSVCNFTPSCSHFSTEAFKKAGFFKGLLLTSDRLQRCNGFASLSNVYKYDPQKGKYADPIEHYLFLDKRKK